MPSPRLAFLSCVALLLGVRASPQPCMGMAGKTFDVVIVGSGPCAGPVARRHVDQGRTVAIIEKGPYFHPPPGDQAAKVSGKDYEDTFIINKVHEASAGPAPPVKRKQAYPYLQYQGFGGQSLTYGGIYMRPSPAAFDAWPEITYDEMLPYYKRLENATATWACAAPGTSGPGHDCSRRQGNASTRGYMPIHRERTGKMATIAQPIATLCQRFAGASVVNNVNVSGWVDTNADGQDYNAAPTMRAFCGPPQLYQEVDAATDRVTRRGSLQFTYLPEAFTKASSSRLSVCVNAAVDHLEFAADNATVTAAVLASGLVVKGKRFVLSCGVCFTPEMLMKSGIGEAAVLKRYTAPGVGPHLIDLPDVGRHFHDEWAFSLSFEITTNASYWLADGAGRFLRDQMQLAKFSTGAWGADFTDVQLYYRTGNQMSLDAFLPSSAQLGVPSAKRAVPSTGKGFLAIRVAMFQKASFGRDSGFFPSGTDGVRPNRFTNDVKMFGSDDLRRKFMTGAAAGYGMAMKFVEALREMKTPTGEHLELRPIKTTADLIDSASDPKAFEAVLMDYGNVLALHGGGTAGIGRVVDPNLRVLRTTNLYVCDMSVFPTPVDANPTATIFALGERLADQLYRRGRAPPALCVP